MQTFKNISTLCEHSGVQKNRIFPVGSADSCSDDTRANGVGLEPRKKMPLRLAARRLTSAKKIRFGNRFCSKQKLSDTAVS